MHDTRLQQGQPFVTVQIGAYDGYSNDPFSWAFFRGSPAPIAAHAGGPMANWVGVLVEPLYTEQLQRTYEGYDAFGVNMSQLKFVRSVISDRCQMNNRGDKYTKFFKVQYSKDRCPFDKPWLQQISGSNETLLRLEFRDKYADCVKELVLPCQSVADLLGATLGVPSRARPLCCLRPTDPGARVGRQQCGLSSRHSSATVSLPWIDVVVIDAEGSDGAVVNMLLSELCPTLWPAAIVFEDKVARYHGFDANAVLERLRSSGYYVMLVGEDAMALRIDKDNKIFNNMTVQRRRQPSISDRKTSIVH